jgi:hypothetical protein
MPLFFLRLINFETKLLLAFLKKTGYTYRGPSQPHVSASTVLLKIHSRFNTSFPREIQTIADLARRDWKLDQLSVYLFSIYLSIYLSIYTTKNYGLSTSTGRTKHHPVILFSSGDFYRANRWPLPLSHARLSPRPPPRIPHPRPLGQSRLLLPR